MWINFLSDKSKYVVCRPMIDLSKAVQAAEIGFSSDVSAKSTRGFGCVFGNKWTWGSWEPGYIDKLHPSIEYLKLFAMITVVLTWEYELRNIRMIVLCNNQVVVSMVNNLSSSCPHCMTLIRILVLNGLKFNRRVFAQYLTTKQNFLSDTLSRGQLERFFRLAPLTMSHSPDCLSEQMWHEFM